MESGNLSDFLAMKTGRNQFPEGKKNYQKICEKGIYFSALTFKILER